MCLLQTTRSSAENSAQVSEASGGGGVDAAHPPVYFCKVSKNTLALAIKHLQ